MTKFSLETLGDIPWRVWRKPGTTAAIRVYSRFEVETIEGTLMCDDGYLALDNNGNPYPVAKDVFEAIYERC